MKTQKKTFALKAGVNMLLKLIPGFAEDSETFKDCIIYQNYKLIQKFSQDC